MNPLFHIEFSISDSFKNVRKSVLIYETIIIDQWKILAFWCNRINRGNAFGKKTFIKRTEKFDHIW